MEESNKALDNLDQVEISVNIEQSNIQRENSNIIAIGKKKNSVQQ